MPDRVVTADLEGLLGVPVIAAVGVPYREGASLPGPLQGGIFLDLIVALPAGVRDASELNGHIFEATSSAPGPLKQLNAGPLHQIWGWSKRIGELDPSNPDDALIINSSRFAPVMYDIGGRLNRKITRSRPLSLGNGRVSAEVLYDSPGNSGNRPIDGLYDTLDAHPPGLRAALERSPWARRETEADDPPGWTQRKPGVP